MQVEMKHIKRTPGSKKKMMLWVDNADVEFLEKLEPDTITIQSKIRQVLTAYRLEADAIGEL